MKPLQRNILGLLAAAMSGSALGLALCGYNLFWLAWIALVPLFVALKNASVRQCVVLACVAAFCEAACVFAWIPITVHHMSGKVGPAVIIAGVFALYWCIVFSLLLLAVRWLTRRTAERWTSFRLAFVPVLVVPVLWVLFEYVHSLLITHLNITFFPLVAYTQWGCPEMLQPAAGFGIHAISFVVVLCNVLIARSITQKKPWPLLFGTALILVVFSLGIIRIRVGTFSSSARTFRVAILQGHIRADEKFDKAKSAAIAKRYLALCREAVEHKPDLIVWTETAIPWPLEEADNLAETALRITAPIGAAHILGAPFTVPGRKDIYHNTAHFVLPDGRVTSQYHKTRMLAFVEEAVTVPGSSKPYKLHPTSPDYISAERLLVLDSPKGKIGVNICNENFCPALSRLAANRGAELTAHLANDIWFKTDAPLLEHFAANAFRAVETGRDTIVANNAGISGFVDAYGRIMRQGDMRKPLVLTGQVRMNRRQTLYTRIGDAFVWVCVVILAGLLIPCLRRKGE